MSFERLFHPKGIAIIGASADLGRIGGHPIKALKNAGYTGGISLINPKYPELHGLHVLPRRHVIERALRPGRGGRACARRRPGDPRLRQGRHPVRGGADRRLPRDRSRRAQAREGGSRPLSPKAACASSAPTARACCPSSRACSAAFGSVADETDLRPGTVSCAFQSGGFGYAIVNLAEAQGVGFRYCVSSGNETDIAMPELLSAFLDDPGTRWPSPTWRVRPMRGACSTSDASRSRRASRC